MPRVVEEADALKAVLECHRTEPSRHRTEEFVSLPVGPRIGFASCDDHARAAAEASQAVERAFVDERLSSDFASDLVDFGSPASVVVKICETLGDQQMQLGGGATCRKADQRPKHRHVLHQTEMERDKR